MSAALFVSKRLQRAVLALLLITAAQLAGALTLPRTNVPPGAVIVPISR